MNHISISQSIHVQEAPQAVPGGKMWNGFTLYLKDLLAEMAAWFQVDQI